MWISKVDDSSPSLEDLYAVICDNKNMSTLNNYQMVYLIQWLSLHASFAESRK